MLDNKLKFTSYKYTQHNLNTIYALVVGTILCLSTMTYAECSTNTQHTYTEQTPQEKEQELLNYRQQMLKVEPLQHPLAVAYELVSRPDAVQPNHDNAKYYLAIQQQIESEVMHQDLASLSNAKQNNRPSDRDMAINDLMILAQASYVGEFIPKNEENAVRYLQKVVEYFQVYKKSTAYPFEISFLMNLGADNLSKKNPILQQTDRETTLQISALFIRAGSLDSEAMLLIEDYGRMIDKNSQSKALQRLKVLAKKGSMIATEGLAELF